MAYQSTKPARVTFSKPFSDLLVEVSIAVQKFMMYPDGHPLLGPAASAVVRRAERIMEDRATIAFGVARHQLIIEGVATDPKQPVLRRLADSLNRHHLGAISFSRGLTSTEIAEALRQVGTDTITNGVMPIGLRPAHELPTWPHVRLHPLTFDRLALVGDDAAKPKSDHETRGTELWIGLASAAMTKTGAASDEPVPTEPAVIARAIEEHERVEAYDQVIVGYLQQIARELRDASSAEIASLRRRTARLLTSLKPETLRHLVEMGGDVAQRRSFVLDASHGMAMDSVLGIVQAAADASGQVISQGLIRMFTKLAMHAEGGPSRAREMAGGALREQIDRLMSGWELEDPSPAEHGRLLQRLATESSPASPRTEADHAQDGEDANGGTRNDAPDCLRVIQMSLELGSTGIVVDQSVDQAVEQGRVGAVLELLVSAPSGSGGPIDDILTRLTTPESIARLVAREPVDFASVEQLLPLLSLDAHRVLVDALANTEHRRTRRKLLNLLAGAQADITALAIERLGDERWFVQRNMLVLLHTRGQLPPGFSAAMWTMHPDPRVSHEAIRLQLTIPRERSQAIRAALNSGEPHIVRLGLVALQLECPADLVDLVVAVANDPKSSEEHRTLAVRALAYIVPHSRDPQVLDALLATVDGGTTLFGRQRLAAPTSRVLAALATLHEQWADHERAAMMIELARASEFPDVRRAAGVPSSAA